MMATAVADWRANPGTCGEGGRRLERIAAVRESEPARKVAADTLPPRGPGAFRKEFIAKKASNRIGIGVLTYMGLGDVQINVPSILEHAQPNCDVFVFDNSENGHIGAWLNAKCPQVTYIKSPENVGCANGRNRMLEWSASRGHQWVLMQDQDVRWAGDAGAAMLAVARHYPDTGCVSWPLAVKQMGNHKWDKTGALDPPETPGMCCLYSVKALTEGDDPGLVAWCPDYHMYRFDTDACFSLSKKGYAVRAVIDGPSLVRHDHPHTGIKRYPRWREEQRRSLGIFAERAKRYGWPSI